MTAKKSSAKKTARKSAKKSARSPGTKRWVKTVTTDSTHPPEGLFNKDAATIARSLASKRVSPKGPASGMRMLVYFLNRGGKGLSAARRRELEHAKELLHKKVVAARDSKKSAKSSR